MSSDPAIQVLPDQIINKIAAGEVVDRPASVMKELMENALDAGARQIQVTVVDGGMKLLSVSDDGHGMSRDNALLAIERHATSKIRHVDDIEKVTTLGFRGEALAAIASVSRFTLITRRSEDLSGTEIKINGGRIEDVTEAGSPTGTCMEVRQLFFNVPARRKFLKAPATELNYIRQVFMLYAMGRPDVGLRLVVDEREIYRLDGDSQLEDRIRQLYGTEIMTDLAVVNWERKPWKITGLVSRPRLHRSDKSEQFIFINGRPASAPVLGYAVGESYQEVLPRGRNPLIFLFIEIPPDEVDVNVHPTKKEVRFRHAANIRDAVMAAIRGALQTSAHSPSLNDLNSPSPKPEIKIGSFLKVPDLPVLPAFDYPRKKDSSSVSFTGRPSLDPASKNADTEPERPGQSSKAPWHWCRILGQIADYFVVLETDEGMIIMDPQAAHERVLFDRLMKDAQRKKITTQGLLVPETVSLTPVKAGMIRRQISLLKELGIGVSEFGGDTFILESLPSALGQVGGETLLQDIAEKLEQLGKSGISAALLRESIAQTAAQLAVRTTTQLSREELEILISDLAMTALPYTSPRGRPTLIFTSLQELKKKFGRT